MSNQARKTLTQTIKSHRNAVNDFDPDDSKWQHEIKTIILADVDGSINSNLNVGGKISSSVVQTAVGEVSGGFIRSALSEGSADVLVVITSKKVVS